MENAEAVSALSRSKNAFMNAARSTASRRPGPVNMHSGSLQSFTRYSR